MGPGPGPAIIRVRMSLGKVEICGGGTDLARVEDRRAALQTSKQTTVG